MSGEAATSSSTNSTIFNKNFKIFRRIPFFRENLNGLKFTYGSDSVRRCRLANSRATTDFRRSTFCLRHDCRRRPEDDTDVAVFFSTFFHTKSHDSIKHFLALTNRCGSLRGDFVDFHIFSIRSLFAVEIVKKTHKIRLVSSNHTVARTLTMTTGHLLLVSTWAKADHHFANYIKSIRYAFSSHPTEFVLV